MNIKTLIRTSLIALGLTLAPLGVAAQNLFSAAILVNDQAITNYELKQRTMFLKALRFPGVPEELAPKQLIEERLKKAAADQLGIHVSEEELQFELESFAQRFNVAFDEFAAELERVGISVDTQFPQKKAHMPNLIRAISLPYPAFPHLIVSKQDSVGRWV